MNNNMARSVAFPVGPTDFIDVSYDSSLLLDARLSAAITDDSDFRSFCELGFDAYFDGLVSRSGDLGDRFYTVGEVRREVFRDVYTAYKEQETPLAACVGLSLGWLSALALAQYWEAQEGLRQLMALLECLS